MATLQEIEDGIRRLHRINPQDPRIKQLGEARKQMLSGGGGAPAEPEGPGLLTRAMQAMEGAGKNVREAVMNPGQSIPDALRTASNFVTLGGRDRAAPFLGSGRTHEQEKTETAAADERLGSIDEALNLGGALLQPSAAAKYAPAAGGLLKQAGKRASAWGAEGAALGGAQAAIEGEDPGQAMLEGAGFGAAGSAAGDLLSPFTRSSPKFKTDEDLFKAAAREPRTTRHGKDLARAASRTEAARLAQTKGQAGFKEMNDELVRVGRKQGKYTLDEAEQLSKLAHMKPKKNIVAEGAADVLQGGGGSIGKGMMGWWNAGLLPSIGAAARTASKVMDEVPPAEIEKFKAMQRAVGGNNPPTLDPEMVDKLRNILARMGAGAGGGRV